MDPLYLYFVGMLSGAMGGWLYATLNYQSELRKLRTSVEELKEARKQEIQNREKAALKESKADLSEPFHFEPPMSPLRLSTTTKDKFHSFFTKFNSEQ